MNFIKIATLRNITCLIFVIFRRLYEMKVFFHLAENLNYPALFFKIKHFLAYPEYRYKDFLEENL